LNVVQTLTAAPVGRRERTRRARYTSYLATAKHIVATEGLDALSMQRLADEVDSAIGTVYTYFPSKSALVAAVQRDAIERLTRSYLLGREALERTLSRRPADATAALARLVAFGWWFADTVEVFPEEAHLLQLLMAELRPAVSDADAGAVLPAAMELLDHARRCLAEADGVDALDRGDSMERTVVLAAAMNGVLLLSRLRRFDNALFDGPRLARALVLDLFRGWGADPATLTAAAHLVEGVARRHPLAPLVPDGELETVR
jgi:AcrR family transcriptional regulator